MCKLKYLSNCHNIHNLTKTKMFSYRSPTYDANIKIISIYLNAYKTIEDIYGTYRSYF